MACLALLVMTGLGGVPGGRALGAELAPAKGRVILEISGAITGTNADGKAQFDREMLAALPSHEVLAMTPWTEGETQFSGPLLRDVLALVGATGANLRSVALNDYAVTIPREDAESFDVIVAMTMNGEVLTPRNKGPLWVIYPWDQHAELRIETYYQRSIWQLSSIVVE